MSQEALYGRASIVAALSRADVRQKRIESRAGCVRSRREAGAPLGPIRIHEANSASGPEVTLAPLFATGKGGHPKLIGRVLECLRVCGPLSLREAASGIKVPDEAADHRGDTARNDSHVHGLHRQSGIRSVQQSLRARA